MEKNLQNNVSEMTKVEVRFPNEFFFQEIPIDLSIFVPHKKFDDETFGRHGDMDNANHIGIYSNIFHYDYYLFFNSF